MKNSIWPLIPSNGGTSGSSGWPANKICPECGSDFGHSEGKSMEEVEYEDRTHKKVDVKSECKECGWLGMESQLVTKKGYLKILHKKRMAVRKQKLEKLKNNGRSNGVVGSNK